MSRNLTFATQAKEWNKALIQELIKARKSKSPQFTRADLARALGIDQSNALRLESGEHGISMERFFEICLILEVEPSDLISKISLADNLS